MPNYSSGGVKFEDYSMKVIGSLESAVSTFLKEAGGEMTAQIKRNTRVDTGQLKGSFKYVVDESNEIVTIGSNLENAIWEEFGTGEYALKGNGRKTPWRYQDIHGDWHTTTGKKPSRAMQKAFDSKKNAIKKAAQEILGAKIK